MSTQHETVSKFRQLHQSGCFVMPNPWDAGSAKYFESVGFQAVATTSSGFAFTLGLPDAVDALSLDVVLDHFRQIARATSLPVNADFQNGFADEPEKVFASVAQCVGTGVAGLSIEDSTGDAQAPLYEHRLAIERVKAARLAIDASGVPVVLTARSEAWLVGHPEAGKVALERLVAFAEAGADCLFAPGIQRPEDIAEMVKAVAPLPVNFLILAPSAELSVARLEDLGVRRISVGSGLARVAWGAVMRATEDILKTGTFDGLAGAAPFAKLNGLFTTTT